MLYYNPGRPNRMHQVALVALFVCPLVFFAGCATTSTRARKADSCRDCGCATCGAPTMSSVDTDMQNQDLPESAAGLLQYDSSPPSQQDTAEWPYGTPPQPIPPQPVPPEPDLPQPVVVLPQEPSCDSEAREECAQLQEQTEALRAQLERMERQLVNERSRQQGLNQSLAAVNAKVGSLSSELDYWKAQVQQIDTEAEQQHRADLESLETISELISRLPRPATASTETASPRQ